MNFLTYFATCIVCGEDVLTMPSEIPQLPYCSTHSTEDVRTALNQIDEAVRNTRNLLESR